METVCEEKQWMQWMFTSFSLNPLPFSSCFFSRLHTLDITVLIAIVEMGSTMEHLSLMAAGFIDTIYFRKIPNICRTWSRKKDVKQASILKRRGVEASHEACVAKPVQGYIWTHSIYCLCCCCCGISEMWMFIWLNEKVAKCCSLLCPTIWHVYLEHVCAVSGEPEC